MEAATLIKGTLRGELRPTQAASFPAVAINIERQLTSEPHLTPLYDLANRMLQQPGVLSNSILLGFPYADVEEMGSSAIVVTNDDPGLAAGLSRQLGDYLSTHRDDFAGDLISIDNAIARAVAVSGPVCLLDMGDNVGGGSPGDSTHLLHALARSGSPVRSSACSIRRRSRRPLAQVSASGSKCELAERQMRCMARRFRILSRYSASTMASSLSPSHVTAGLLIAIKDQLPSFAPIAA
jgi:microcystin degradation protein MlrC